MWSLQLLPVLVNAIHQSQEKWQAGPWDLKTTEIDHDGVGKMEFIKIIPSPRKMYQNAEQCQVMSVQQIAICLE